MTTPYLLLKTAAEATGDSELINLATTLEPFVGTEDGSKDDEEMALFIEAAAAIANAKSGFVNWRTKQVRRYTEEGKQLNAVNSYTRNLYRLCNEQGDEILNSIHERLIQICL